MITIIIGLGNPGTKFEKTRHNVGFIILDKFVEKNNLNEFKLQKKFGALISESSVNGDKVILAKPQTFMNESGKTAKKLLKNNASKETNIVVIHDDIDLSVGKIKIVKERGSAGHKGVENIINNIGNDGLIRFRVGIGSLQKTKAMNVVLKKFSKKEEPLINESIIKSTEALDLFLKEGLEKTMNEYNK
jgi:PTH1 family peptidyl-tRNA hydrolase